MDEPEPNPRPQRKRSTWRETTCDECLETIEIDGDGWRTLCACDATA